MPRALPRKIVLPEGELRRFRLPESTGDDRQGAPQSGDHRLSLAAGWLAFTGLCLWFGQADFSPVTWMRQAGAHPGESRTVAASPPSRSRPTSSPPRRNGATVSRPAEPRQRTTPLKAVLQTPSSLSIHGGGIGAGTFPAPSERDSRDAFADDLSGKPSSRLLDEPTNSRPLISRTASADKGDAQDLWREFQEDLTPVRGFDASPIKLKAWEPFRATRPPERLPRQDARAAEVTETGPKASKGGVGVARISGGCERAFESAETRVDMAGPREKDVPREVYARQMEDFSNFARCGVSDDVDVTICAAVQSGKALGVTVTTKPPSQAAARCIAGIMQGFSFPRSANPDLVRTEFRSR